jgi:hypothetical protein
VGESGALPESARGIVERFGAAPTSALTPSAVPPAARAAKSVLAFLNALVAPVATSGDFADSAWKRVARAACFFAQCRVAAGKLSLSPARVIVLHAYTLHAPVAALVNAALRAGDEHEWVPFAAHFWAALSRLPVRRAVLYRAVRLPREQLYALLEDYSRGATVLWDHFASMTTDPQRAAPWLNAAAAAAPADDLVTAVIRVRSTSARCVGEFSLHPELDEHVLPANVVLTVKSITSWRADQALPHTLLASEDVDRPDAQQWSVVSLTRNGFGIGEMVHALADTNPARTVRDILKGETLLFDLDEQATL